RGDGDECGLRTAAAAIGAGSSEAGAGGDEILRLVRRDDGSGSGAVLAVVQAGLSPPVRGGGDAAGCRGVPAVYARAWNARGGEWPRRRRALPPGRHEAAYRRVDTGVYGVPEPAVLHRRRWSRAIVCRVPDVPI